MILHDDCEFTLLSMWYSQDLGYIRTEVKVISDFPNLWKCRDKADEQKDPNNRR